MEQNDDENEVSRDDLIQYAALGKEVELFWGSRVGQYLQSRAQAHYNEGIEEFKHVDPTDYRAVLNAQNKVWLGENVEKWLDQAVRNGLVALQILDEDGKNE